MVPWAHPRPQPKRHLDRFRLVCRAHLCDRPMDRPTDRPRYSVSNNRPHSTYVVLRYGLKMFQQIYEQIVLYPNSERMTNIGVLTNMFYRSGRTSLGHRQSNRRCKNGILSRFLGDRLIRSMLSADCLSCLSVTLVYCGQTALDGSCAT